MRKKKKDGKKKQELDGSCFKRIVRDTYPF